jgi:Mn-dependent DtxR family transcriptional regulator
VMAEDLSEQAQEAAQAATRSDEDAVLVLLLHGGGSSNSNIAKALGWFMRDGSPYKVRVRRVLERLKKSKLVTVDDREGACLTDKGKKEAQKCA